MRIERSAVSAYRIPTDGPEGDGTILWDQTTLVVVELGCGSHKGFGYSYSSAASAQVVNDILLPLLKKHDVFDLRASWNEMLKAVRNMGRHGVVASAIASVDTALWDLKAKTLGLPLVKLFGQVHESIPIYGSGGFTTYDESRLREQLGGWQSEGIEMAKIKIGFNFKADFDRIRWGREAFGPKGKLFLDANGAYTQRQALEIAKYAEQFGVDWFEEPVTSENLRGLKWLRDHVPARMQIAAGEYGYDALYFKRMLEADAVDVLQADATRCLGFSGFLQAAELCDIFEVPLSAHTAPSLHMHVACAATRAVHVEYFYDHSRIEKMFFDGFIAPIQGKLRPDLSRPGMGLQLRHSDIQKYKI